MDDFPECERFTGRRRAICRRELLTADRQDRYRRRWGFDSANASAPPQDHAGATTKPKQARKLRGLGDVVDAVTTATGIKAAVHATATALGFDCGCAGRREALNRAVPFGKPE